MYTSLIIHKTLIIAAIFLILTKGHVFDELKLNDVSKKHSRKAHARTVREAISGLLSDTQEVSADGENVDKGKQKKTKNVKRTKKGQA